MMNNTMQLKEIAEELGLTLEETGYIYVSAIRKLRSRRHLPVRIALQDYLLNDEDNGVWEYVNSLVDGELGGGINIDYAGDE